MAYERPRRSSNYIQGGGIILEDHIYLVHHGIKGMKWGVRRFRNEDGSLTEAGKKRYSNDVDRAFDSLAKSGRPQRRSLSKEEIADLNRTSKQSGNAISGAKNVVSGAQRIAKASDNQPRNRYNKRPNLTQDEMDRMSDKELRELVNRLNLEQQYSQLTEDNVPRSRVSAGLEYAAAALEIAGGALTVYAAYQMLKG